MFLNNEKNSHMGYKEPKKPREIVDDRSEIAQENVEDPVIDRVDTQREMTEDRSDKVQEQSEYQIEENEESDIESSDMSLDSLLDQNWSPSQEASSSSSSFSNSSDNASCAFASDSRPTFEEMPHDTSPLQAMHFDNESSSENSEKTPTMAVLATNSATNKQKWDKRHSCKYCSKLYVKIARHLEDCHSREEDVHAAMQYPKRSTQRKRAWDKLRNDGDFDHNMDVFKHQEGTIIPKYRSKAGINKQANDYLPCTYCKAMYVSKELNDHQHRCPLKADESSLTSKKRGQAVLQGRLLIPVSKEESVWAALQHDVGWQSVRQCIANADSE